jgi:hypothetical protein
MVSTRSLSIIILVAVLIAGIFGLSDPLPQDPAYHAFSDVRNLFGVPNFWNVVSNLPFLLIGAAGLWFLHSNAEEVCIPGTVLAYRVFYIGILLTAFGSAYYHLAPSNERLVWDRLPMTIGFAGLLTIIIAEFVSATAARRLLFPLLAIGMASVVFWAWSEAKGAGDLRPYAIVQFLPMLLIPVVLLTHQPTIGNRKVFWWMLAFYLIAKIFEFLDPSILALGNLVSGHSLKHLAAAMTPAIFLYALTLRR